MDEETPILPQLSKPDQLEQQNREEVARRVKTGANWFYWIAGLSLVNTALTYFESDRRFVIGLGITEVIDVLGKEMGSTARIIPMALDALVMGIFILFGWKAGERSKGAFLTGMIVYALDGVLLLLFQDYFSAAFHGLALFYIFKGFSAVNELRAMEPTGVPAGLSDVKLD